MAIVRRLALSLAILVNLLATTAAGGATCAGAHTPSLSNGTASPASGTTATLFTFSVTFKDSKGCVPNRVWVAVSGVNNFDMTTSGTDFLQGVTYRVSTTLPVTGVHSYSFFATSGSTVGTTSVTPSSITVTAVPTPTPVPTPVETPVPTPKPTPRAPISGGVLNGKAVRLVTPPYPAIARSAHASGSVQVQVLIDENGNVVTAHAVSGHPLLQAAAVAAARASKFTPTKLSGQPVKVNGVIIYNFVAQ